MIRFTCETVYGGWPDVANPDDIDAMLDLGQTKHKFYPALRELVLLYDAIADKREAVYTIGLGGSMKVSAKNADDDLVEVNLALVCFVAERDRTLEPLGELLVEVFKAKDAMSTQEDRERGPRESNHGSTNMMDKLMFMPCMLISCLELKSKLPQVSCLEI